MKGIITITVLIAAALIFSISIAPYLVHAQVGLNQNQSQTQGNQTGNNNSSIQIGPGALIYPSYKPCKDNPGVLCSFYQKPPVPPPVLPNMTMLPPPLSVLGPLPNLGKIPDNLFQQCMALHNGQEPPPSVFNTSSKKIPAPYGTELPVCAIFPQFSQPTNMSNTLPLTTVLPPGAVLSGLTPPPLIPPSQLMQNLSKLPHAGLPPADIPLPPGLHPVPPPPLTLTLADLREIQASTQYVTNTQNEILTTVGNDRSTAHMAQVLKQMIAEGRIICHLPFTTELGCIFAPRVAGKHVFSNTYGTTHLAK